MKHTANYKLNLPEYTDIVDVKDFNDNFETIETHLAGKLGYLGVVSDVDSAMESGMYGVHGGTIGLPEELAGNMQGSLLVLNPPGMGDDGWCTQILTGYDYNRGTDVYRRRTYNDVYKSWSAWQATPSETDMETLQDRVGTNESAIRTAQSSLSSLYDGSVTVRGSITATTQSDLDVTQSGIYNVRISARFPLDGSSDQQEGGGLLIVFGRNDHSALQLWLLLNENNRNEGCRLYWRFLQTDDEEGYILPGTNFKIV